MRWSRRPWRQAEPWTTAREPCERAQASLKASTLSSLARHGIGHFKYYAKYFEYAGRVTKKMAGWREKYALCVLYTASHDVYSMTNASELWRKRRRRAVWQFPLGLLGQTALDGAVVDDSALSVAMWQSSIPAQGGDHFAFAMKRGKKDRPLLLECLICLCLLQIEH